VIVLYSFAHTDPRKSAGAQVGPVSERLVSGRAWEAFRTRCQNDRHRTQAIAGPLEAQVRFLNKHIRQAKKDGEKWASVALHFNEVPEGRDWRRWKLGHTVIVRKSSRASIELGDLVLDKLSEIMPWSPRKEQIQLPDSRYGKLLWRYVWTPAVLVEAGFSQDPKFAEWIIKTENQNAYGMAVADAVCEFAERRESVPIEHWHK